MPGTTFDLYEKAAKLGKVQSDLAKPLDRFGHEVQFAVGLARATPEKTDAWMALIAKAAAMLERVADSQGAIAAAAAVPEAEAILAPIGEAAKAYTIHCCGHGHIDMNWMWGWPETVSVCHDTFRTVDKLMDEYPEFRYSQSQVSIYEAMRVYHPEILERIKARVAEGRWEVTASQWVEGDKNLASGETLARHLLYTRRWLKEHLGLEPDDAKIDWECDTFGHAWTVPGILNRGGVRRYYFHRAGCKKRLFWWEGKDGSRVLAYDDYPVGYNCQIAPYMAEQLLRFSAETGLKDMMWVYGVGDHGGGPTRQHLDAAADMRTWPVWPKVVLSTTDAYYTLIEGQADKLPVVKDELNFVFRGCYTAQSAIKRDNHLCQTNLVEAELWAAIASGVAGVPYPAESFRSAWENAMFIQFHDILPGSGVRETREHCSGLTQEALARTQAAKTAALHALARKVDTKALAPAGPGPDLGAGPGLGSAQGGVSAASSGSGPGGVFVVFNGVPRSRSEVVRARIWDHAIPDDAIAIRDGSGGATRAQVLGKGHYWGHDWTEIAFAAESVPSVGYRAYGVGASAEAQPSAGVSATYTRAELTGELEGPVALENAFLRAVVSPGSGAISSLIDKRTGRELVPAGRQLGVLVHQVEAPHGMTSWCTGQISEERELLEGASLQVTAHGPYVASVTSRRTYRGCALTWTVSLCAGSPRLDFHLEYDWRDFGGPEIGAPVLKVGFPLAVSGEKARFEIPFGYIERPLNGAEVPGLRWADLSGNGGAALLTRGKHGFTVTPDEMRVTILRASYDPDPLPEVGRSEAALALVVHDGAMTATEITEEAQAFATPLIPVSTDAHDGDLPLAAGFIEVEGALLSSLKRAEDSDALLARLYEVEGAETKASVRLANGLTASGDPAELDLLERPVAECMAEPIDGGAAVRVPAFGVATVKV